MRHESTEFGILSQPHPVGKPSYRIRMNKLDSKAVLWGNLSALMKKHYGRENLTRMAKEAHIGPGTASRIKEQQTSVGIEVLDSLARVFKVEPWQLLVPSINTAALPQIGNSAWPLQGIDANAVARLPSDVRGKIEAYIESKLEDYAVSESRKLA